MNSLHPNAPPTPPVELSGLLEASNLGIFHGDRSVKVGDSWSHALSVFPEPARGAYQIHDLPNAFSEKFEAHGWETATGEGFGVILTDNKIVGALYEVENIKQDTVDDLLREERVGMNSQKPTLLGSGDVKYWIWSGKDQIAMACAFATKDGINFTMGMGDENVMKSLGMSQEAARYQIAEVNRRSSGTESILQSTTK